MIKYLKQFFCRHNWVLERAHHTVKNLKGVKKTVFVTECSICAKCRKVKNLVTEFPLFQD